MTTTSTTTCRKCSERIINGLDEYSKCVVRVDRLPISRDVEVLCVIAKRRVYEVDREQRIRLRTPKATLYRASHYDLHPEHICGQVLPAKPKPAEVATFDTSAEPPF